MEWETLLGFSFTTQSQTCVHIQLVSTSGVTGGLPKHYWFWLFINLFDDFEVVCFKDLITVFPENMKQMVKNTTFINKLDLFDKERQNRIISLITY